MSMTEETVIRGRVAQILNDRELIIDVGIENGVENGMTFAILDPRLLDVRDVERHKLGSLERTIVEIKVVEVTEKFSIGRTFRSQRTVSALTGVASLFTSGSEFQTLRVTDTPYGPLEAEDSIVKPGYPVVHRSRQSP